MTKIPIPLPTEPPLYTSELCDCAARVCVETSASSNYKFFPNMDHAGDNDSSLSLPCRYASYEINMINILLSEIHPLSGYLAGFTIREFSGEVQICVKTSAVGSSVHPILNIPSADLPFSGTCDGTYILIPRKSEWWWSWYGLSCGVVQCFYYHDLFVCLWSHCSKLAFGSGSPSHKKIVCHNVKL